MARFCPAYPTPRRNKASGLLMFLSARHSWLDALYERSYRMQMGEVRLPGLDLYMVNEPGLVRRVMVEQSEVSCQPWTVEVNALSAVADRTAEQRRQAGGSRWRCGGAGGCRRPRSTR